DAPGAQPGAKHHRALFSLRTACGRFAVRPSVVEWSRGVKSGVNDVIKRIEADYRRDGRDHAGGRVGAYSRSAPSHRQTPVAGNGANEQTEHETFQNAGDDIANQQRVLYQVEKIG